MKKHIDRKKLVLDHQTIRQLEVTEVARAAGGMMDPTNGVCGHSRNTHCPSQATCDC